MKHLLFAALMAATLTGCGSGDKTSYAFKIVQQALDNNPPAQVIALGEMGDFTVYVPENDDLKSLMARPKTAQFLSAPFIPNEHVKPGFCIIDVISKSALEKINRPNSPCLYRLYCGGPDVNIQNLYAIEICR